jgi:hypothetical protein
MHLPVAHQGAWLANVVRGYLAYHSVPTNVHAIVYYGSPLHWIGNGFNVATYFPSSDLSFARVSPFATGLGRT